MVGGGGTAVVPAAACAYVTGVERGEPDGGDGADIEFFESQNSKAVVKHAIRTREKTKKRQTTCSCTHRTVQKYKRSPKLCTIYYRDMQGPYSIAALAVQTHIAYIYTRSVITPCASFRGKVTVP